MLDAENKGLSLEELRQYSGFESLSYEELKRALRFIEDMAELIQSIN